MLKKVLHRGNMVIIKEFTMTKGYTYFEGQLFTKLLCWSMGCGQCYWTSPLGFRKPGEKSLRGQILKAVVSDASYSLRTEPVV